MNRSNKKCYMNLRQGRFLERLIRGEKWQEILDLKFEGPVYVKFTKDV